MQSYSSFFIYSRIDTCVLDILVGSSVTVRTDFRNELSAEEIFQYREK
jgi:hypothetical protein